MRVATFFRFYLEVSQKVLIFAGKNNRKGMVRKIQLRIDNNTRRDLYDKFSDYTLDLSKLVFGGVILAGIMGLSVNPNILFGLGAVSVIILTLVGFVFIILKHNNRR